MLWPKEMRQDWGSEMPDSTDRVCTEFISWPIPRLAVKNKWIKVDCCVKPAGRVYGLGCFYHRMTVKFMSVLSKIEYLHSVSSVFCLARRWLCLTIPRGQQLSEARDNW